MTGEMSDEQKLTSDALTVARWCWAERQWGVSRNGEVGTLPDPGPDCQFSPTRFDADDSGMVQVLGVRDAERVMVERGCEGMYGKALGDLVLTRGDYDGDGVDFPGYAKLAMATPEVRVRAMAAVIRALKEAR